MALQHPHTVSVTEAAARGVPGLVRAAERGESLVVERHGKPVAAVIGMQHLDRIRRFEEDLRDSLLVVARMATDSGVRVDLDDALDALGLDRAELEAELDDDLADGRA